MKFIKNRPLQIFIDALIVSLSLAIAYAMRFESFPPPRGYFKQFLLILPYLVLVRISLFAIFNVYKLVWRYISLRDVPRFLLATISGSIIFVIFRYSVVPLFKLVGILFNQNYISVPYGVLAAEFILTFIGTLAARSLWRMVTEKRQRKHSAISFAGWHKKQRALLVGAGSAGVMVAREFNSRPEIKFEVVGFLDDDPRKQGTIIQGYKVIGGTEHLAEIAVDTDAEVVIIAMAAVPTSVIRNIVEQAKAASLKVQIIPGLYEILSGKINISKIRDVAIEDLLGRAPVSLDEEEIGQFLGNRIVLVSGAGGSIGSEMCRQICRYQPRLLVMVDQSENPLFHIHREIHDTFPEVPHMLRVGSVVERQRMKQIIDECRPDVIVHAAAHKHVPLMELNPTEAIRNNVLGSRNMADLAHECGAEAFVMISTDKAVNPTSIMGATKRLAEIYVQSLARTSRTRFITVRFGNVLGSQGSVVPIFKEQIARGGPVTITHPDMKRYFMTIPEASQLVLQAATMGKGGEIFILDMGEPVYIVNLARDLIRLSGYQPDEDIKIECTGIRPGEKLYEEINLSEENANKTKHPRIWIGKCQASDLATIRQALEGFLPLIVAGEGNKIRQEITRWVPEYTPGRTPVAEPCATAAKDFMVVPPPTVQPLSQTTLPEHA